MSRHRVTWIVLADGEHARFVTAGPEAHFHTFERLDSPTAHLRASELGTDAPGRSFESADVARHAIAPKHDPHEEAKARFADSIAALLNAAAAERRFDRLVLVAPGRVMHEIREHLSPAAVQLLAASFTKDLLKTPDGDLPAHFPDWPLVPTG